MTVVYENKILETYKRSNISKFPIDCLAIIRGIGFTVKTYYEAADNEETLKLFMYYSQDAFTFFDKKLILYNDKAYRRRIRFSLMHECGHIVLGTDDEDAADQFAAEILAPIPIVRRKPWADADSVCKDFDVSVAMANRVIMACKGKKAYDRHQKELIRYFDSFDEKETCSRKIAKQKVKVSENPCDCLPFDWNEMMLIKHDRELYFY